VTHWITGSPNLEPRYATATNQVGGWPEVRRETRAFVIVNAIGFAVIALLATWLLAGVNPRRPWDAAGLALSPVLLVAGLINWDLLAMGFVAAALWAWSRNRPLLTGVFIGLGAATEVYPLFLLAGLLVICLRERRMRELGVAAGAAVAAWLLANLPAMITGWDQWTGYWRWNYGRHAEWGSLWLVAQEAMAKPDSPFQYQAHTLNIASVLFFGAWCVALGGLALSAPKTPRLAQLGFLIVAGLLLVSRVYSPQYALWLLPLAVLARPRWRDLLIWQAGELLYFAAIWWRLGGFLDPGSGDHAVFYWIATGLRVAAELYLVVRVARDMMRPEGDPGRRVPEPAAAGLAGQANATRSNVVAV
jgi:uncharacterized membrane protein